MLIDACILKEVCQSQLGRIPLKSEVERFQQRFLELLHEGAIASKIKCLAPLLGKGGWGDRCLPKLHLDLLLTHVTFGLSDRRVVVLSQRVVVRLPLVTILNCPLDRKT